jgi:hypothetical protein
VGSLFYIGLLGGTFTLITSIYIILVSKNLIKKEELTDDELASKRKWGKITSRICLLCSFFLLFIAYSIYFV